MGWSNGEFPYFLAGPFQCAFCAEWARLRVVDDVVHAGGPCPAQEGITTTITINVPSGKLIVTDDLRPVYAVDDSGFESYNTRVGQAQYIEAMAAIGCAYGPVGNNSPSLYITGPDSYVIARPSCEDDDGTFPGGKRLAEIVTDLWAYSVADFEDWKARGGDQSTLGWTDTVVDVPRGMYRFTHHTGERGFDEDAPGPVVFAHIERIA